MSDDGLALRLATPDDLPDVLALLRASMGRSDDPRFDALFRWKHLDNGFGPSPAWVAVDGSRLAAVRYLMRWEFERPAPGGGVEIARAVRAVDTATHPDYQGRGLFTRLTLGAIEQLAAEGVDFVFNTPNDQSRPGYLKMGWLDVGRVPLVVRPLGVRAPMRILKARVPADHFSAETRAGEAAADVLGDDAALAALLAARPVPTGLRTRLDPEVLRWRYGGELLRYRAVVAPGGAGRGLALFRLRRRGAATEAALGVVLAADARSERTLVTAVRRAVRREADYVVALGARPARDFLPLRGQGPRLTWRAVVDTAMPPLADWRLTLGDIELF